MALAVVVFPFVHGSFDRRVNTLGEGLGVMVSGLGFGVWGFGFGGKD